MLRGSGVLPALNEWVQVVSVTGATRRPLLSQFVHQFDMFGSRAVMNTLRLLEKHNDRLAGRRTQFRLGFDEIERGEYEDYDAAASPALAEDIKRRGRERLAAKDRNTGK